MSTLKPSKLNGTKAVIGGALALFITITPSMGAPWYLALFGIAVVILSIIAVWNFKNAVEEDEEPETISQISHNTDMPYRQYQKNAASRFCPYCGAKVQGDFEFCNACGKKLP
jgi:hypothetical protein